MSGKSLLVGISLVVFLFSGGSALAECPSADLTGDCFVDFEDFAVMANQWLTTDPCVPDDMVYIPGGEFDMGDPCAEGEPDELPVHAVLLDAFFMSKYEITNSQYCDYLNDANSLGLIEVRSGVVYASPGGTDPYCDTHSADDDSQIDYSGGVFSVRKKGEPPRDMNDDPMVRVSWYGATAYCNWRSGEESYEACYNLSTWDCNFSKHGYRLATEAEWEYAARGGLPGKRFPWADPNITHSLANYYASPGSPSYDVSPTSGYHPAYDDGTMPYTAPVGSFQANGYGLCDMAGNVWEWCNDWYGSHYYSVSPYDNPQGPASGPGRVLRGGCWYEKAVYCRVASRSGSIPDYRDEDRGFRIVLDFCGCNDIDEDGFIIDNGDEGTSSTGIWQVSTVSGFWGVNSLWCIDVSASYSFEAWVTGTREVSLWWTSASDRAVAASVEIYNGAILIDTVVVNQQTNGAQWNVLGTYFFSDKATVKIISDGSAVVVADAVKFEPL